MTNGQCNCGNGIATEARRMTIRIWGTSEIRDVKMCRSCASATDAEAQSHVPFTREYHVANVTRLAGDIRAVVRDWDESLTPSKSQSDAMLLWSRSLSAELSAIAAIDQKERQPK